MAGHFNCRSKGTLAPAIFNDIYVTSVKTDFEELRAVVYSSRNHGEPRYDCTEWRRRVEEEEKEVEVEGAGWRRRWRIRYDPRHNPR